MSLKRGVNIISLFIVTIVLVIIGILYNISQDIGTDYSTVKHRLNTGIYLITILSSMIAITAVIFFRLLICKIVNPIDELNRLIQTMSDTKLNIKGVDELKLLTTNLNRMVDSYKEKVFSLENTIAKKQKAVRELAILNELMGFITSETKFDITMKNLVDRTKDLIKSDYCAAIVFKPDLFATRVFVTNEGIQSPQTVNLSPEGFFKKLLQDQLPLRLDSRQIQSENKTISETDYKQQYIKIPELNLEVKDILAVPLIFSNKLSGLLLLANKLEGSFDWEDEDMLMNFAFQAFQIIAMHDEITNLAVTDGLTGLNNHRYFQEKLTEEVEMAKRYGRNLSLLILDIDHFKIFNDVYGHQVGDMTLKLIASIIERQIRRTDFSARYGGEEFSIIMPETIYSRAKIFAERLRKKIAGTPFPLPNGEKALITVSIGFASIPENTKDKNELIEMADKALYLAKELGRNISCGFADTRTKPSML